MTEKLTEEAARAIINGLKGKTETIRTDFRTLIDGDARAALKYDSLYQFIKGEGLTAYAMPRDIRDDLIGRMAKGGVQAKLVADLFDVSEATVSRIKNGPPPNATKVNATVRKVHGAGVGKRLMHAPGVIDELTKIYGSLGKIPLLTNGRTTRIEPGEAYDEWLTAHPVKGKTIAIEPGNEVPDAPDEVDGPETGAYQASSLAEIDAVITDPSTTVDALTALYRELAARLDLVHFRINGDDTTTTPRRRHYDLAATV